MSGIEIPPPEENTRPAYVATYDAAAAAQDSAMLAMLDLNHAFTKASARVAAAPELSAADFYRTHFLEAPMPPHLDLKKSLRDIVDSTPHHVRLAALELEEAHKAPALPPLTYTLSDADGSPRMSWLVERGLHLHLAGLDAEISAARHELVESEEGLREMTGISLRFGLAAWRAGEGFFNIGLETAVVPLLRPHTSEIAEVSLPTLSLHYHFGEASHAEPAAQPKAPVHILQRNAETTCPIQSRAIRP
jgi:hypothetical protein